MLIILTVLTLVFFLILLIGIRNTMCYDDYEEETVTTVTTTYDFKGVLRRKWENNQPYVTDPADGAKWYLNTNDDMYEDVNGDWWKLV